MASVVACGLSPYPAALGGSASAAKDQANDSFWCWALENDSNNGSKRLQRWLQRLPLDKLGAEPVGQDTAAAAAARGKAFVGAIDQRGTVLVASAEPHSDSLSLTLWPVGRGSRASQIAVDLSDSAWCDVGGEAVVVCAALEQSDLEGGDGEDDTSCAFVLVSDRGGILLLECFRSAENDAGRLHRSGQAFVPPTVSASWVAHCSSSLSVQQNDANLSSGRPRGGGWLSWLKPTITASSVAEHEITSGSPRVRVLDGKYCTMSDLSRHSYLWVLCEMVGNGEQLIQVWQVSSFDNAEETVKHQSDISFPPHQNIRYSRIAPGPISHGEQQLALCTTFGDVSMFRVRNPPLLLDDANIIWTTPTAERYTCVGWSTRLNILMWSQSSIAPLCCWNATNGQLVTKDILPAGYLGFAISHDLDTFALCADHAFCFFLISPVRTANLAPLASEIFLSHPSASHTHDAQELLDQQKSGDLSKSLSEIMLAATQEVVERVPVANAALTLLEATKLVDDSRLFCEATASACTAIAVAWPHAPKAAEHRQTVCHELSGELEDKVSRMHTFARILDTIGAPSVALDIATSELFFVRSHSMLASLLDDHRCSSVLRWFMTDLDLRHNDAPLSFNSDTSSPLIVQLGETLLRCASSACEVRSNVLRHARTRQLLDLAKLSPYEVFFRDAAFYAHTSMVWIFEAGVDGKSRLEDSALEFVGSALCAGFWTVPLFESCSVSFADMSKSFRKAFSRTVQATFDFTWDQCCSPAAADALSSSSLVDASSFPILQLFDGWVWMLSSVLVDSSPSLHASILFVPLLRRVLLVISTVLVRSCVLLNCMNAAYDVILRLANVDELDAYELAKSNLVSGALAELCARSDNSQKIAETLLALSGCQVSFDSFLDALFTRIVHIGDLKRLLRLVSDGSFAPASVEGAGDISQRAQRRLARFLKRIDVPLSEAELDKYSVAGKFQVTDLRWIHALRCGDTAAASTAIWELLLETNNRDSGDASKTSVIPLPPTRARTLCSLGKLAAVVDRDCERIAEFDSLLQLVSSHEVADESGEQPLSLNTEAVIFALVDSSKDASLDRYLPNVRRAFEMWFQLRGRSPGRAHEILPSAVALALPGGGDWAGLFAELQRHQFSARFPVAEEAVTKFPFVAIFQELLARDDCPAAEMKAALRDVLAEFAHGQSRYDISSIACNATALVLGISDYVQPQLLTAEPKTLRAGVAERIGRRPAMEDATLVAVGLSSAPLAGHSVFAIFDGHGGPHAAKFCADHFLAHLSSSFDSFGIASQVDGQAALSNAFGTLDAQLIKQDEGESGSTAVVCVVDARSAPSVVHCANIGDAEAFILNETHGQLSCRMLSAIHKPTDAAEKARVESAGGFVANGRIAGMLAVSRAFGDRMFKVPQNQSERDWVTAEPFTSSHELADSDRAIVLACDGMYEQLDQEQVARVVWESLAAGGSPESAAKAAVDAAYESKSRDNISCIVVLLQ